MRLLDPAPLLLDSCLKTRWSRKWQLFPEQTQLPMLLTICAVCAFFPSYTDLSQIICKVSAVVLCTGSVKFRIIISRKTLNLNNLLPLALRYSGILIKVLQKYFCRIEHLCTVGSDLILLSYFARGTKKHALSLDIWKHSKDSGISVPESTSMLLSLFQSGCVKPLQWRVYSTANCMTFGKLRLISSFI